MQIRSHNQFEKNTIWIKLKISFLDSLYIKTSPTVIILSWKNFAVQIWHAHIGGRNRILPT